MTDSAVARGISYAVNVESGRVAAPHWIRLAVQRFQRDLDRASVGDVPWMFRANLADEAISLIEMFRHYKGELAGQPITLEPWQCFILMQLFGFVDTETGARRFREAYIAVPRKNGKTTLAAGLGLYLGFMEGEGGAEVYSAAVTKEQAKICFDSARHMARQSPEFCDYFGVEVLQNQIRNKAGCVFRPLSSEAKSLDGSSPYCSVLDELAAHRTPEVYESQKRGMGARKQPLLVSITTATNNVTGIGRTRWQYAERVLKSQVEDEAFFAVMYCADEDDDRWDEKTWRKANPNYGVSISVQSFREGANQAKNDSTHETAFLTKNLNLWEGASDAMFSGRHWAMCKDESLKLSDFEGRPCYVGVDLATHHDLAAWALIFDSPRGWVVFAHAYLPEHTFREGRIAQFAEWRKSGWLTVTDGAATDMARVQADLLELSKRFRFEVMAFDDWQASQMMQFFELKGERVVKTKPSAGDCSEACKELQRRHKTEGISHNGNPILAWCMSNVVGREDVNQNIRPVKDYHDSKIDLAIALIFAASAKIRIPVLPQVGAPVFV